MSCGGDYKTVEDVLQKSQKKNGYKIGLIYNPKQLYAFTIYFICAIIFITIHLDFQHIIYRKILFLYNFYYSVCNKINYITRRDINVGYSNTKRSIA